MRRVILKAARARAVWQGHPWVFADSIERIEEDAGGEPDWVQVRDEAGRTLGHGLLSPDSTIRVRLLTRGEDVADPDPLLEERIGDAVALRERLLPDPKQTNVYRLVHAEGDGVPGLVVDRLGEVLVTQFATRPMHDRRARLGAYLLARTGATSLIGRPAGFEAVEGIEAEEPFVLGAPVPERIRVREEGLTLEVAPHVGQKTGHYADQRENRRLVGELASGLDVLDLYCGTGGFALQALRHGAARADAFDASARSVDAAQRGGDLNGVADRLAAQRGDVREALGALRVAKRRFGLVVIDPPNFFPRRGPDRNALKAYRDVNVRALSRVEPGGILATFTCSARLGPAPFLDLVRSAARECRRPFSVLRELTAGPDHPVAAGLPEGRYLSGLLLRVGEPLP